MGVAGYARESAPIHVLPHCRGIRAHVQTRQDTFSGVWLRSGKGVPLMAGTVPLAEQITPTSIGRTVVLWHPGRTRRVPSHPTTLVPPRDPRPRDPPRLPKSPPNGCIL